ncbi:MAG: hypothetical protein WCA35_26110 [Kovacikia sp.]
MTLGWKGFHLAVEAFSDRPGEPLTPEPLQPVPDLLCLPLKLA